MTNYMKKDEMIDVLLDKHLDKCLAVARKLFKGEELKRYIDILKKKNNNDKKSHDFLLTHDDTKLIYDIVTQPLYDSVLEKSRKYLIDEPGKAQMYLTSKEFKFWKVVSNNERFVLLNSLITEACD